MHVLLRVVFLLLFIGLIGCSSTKKSDKVVFSGFLNDYSILRKGDEGEATWVYQNPIAEWKKYTKVIVDPVQVWMGKKSTMQSVSREERVALSTRLWGILSDKLKRDYRITQEPGPEAFRVSVALTEAEASRVMGTAMVEAKITDSQIGNLLVAAVDRRRGTANVTSESGRWGDVEASFEYWASLMIYRLCQWRGQQLCDKPKT